MTDQPTPSPADKARRAHARKALALYTQDEAQNRRLVEDMMRLATLPPASEAAHKLSRVCSGEIMAAAQVSEMARIERAESYPYEMAMRTLWELREGNLQQPPLQRQPDPLYLNAAKEAVRIHALEGSAPAPSPTPSVQRTAAAGTYGI